MNYPKSLEEWVNDKLDNHGGFLSSDDVEHLVKGANNAGRLVPVLVRCGNCRFVCAAQYVQTIIGYVMKGGDYVRDVSLTEESRRAVQAHRLFSIPQVETPIPVRVLPRESRKALPAPLAPDFNEADCGGVFTGNGVISDADPGL